MSAQNSPVNWSSIILQEVALVIRLFCRPSDIGKDLCFSSSRKENDTIHRPVKNRETAKLNKGEEPLVLLSIDVQSSTE